MFISLRVEATFLSMNAVIGTQLCNSLALGGNDQLSYPLFFFEGGIQYRIESSLHLKCSIQEIWYKKVCLHVKYYLPLLKTTILSSRRTQHTRDRVSPSQRSYSFGYRQDTEDTWRGPAVLPCRGAAVQISYLSHMQNILKDLHILLHNLIEK